jgi:hypothetical protein
MALLNSVTPTTPPATGNPLSSGVFAPSVNYMRAFQLTVGSGSALDLSAMRVKFTVRQDSLQAPNTLYARVYNLAKSTGKLIKSLEGQQVTLSAGYQGNFGLIYSGEIRQVNNGRESPTDTYCDIFGGDSDRAINFGVVNKTLAAGSTPQDHWNEALKGLQAVDPNVQQGYVGVDLSQPRYPRSFTLYGMVRHTLRLLAQSKDASYSIQSGKLQLVPNNSAIGGNILVLNSLTGLIGMPTETIGGILIRALINPHLTVNSLVQVNEADINRADLQQAYGASLSQDLAIGKDGLNLGTADGVYRVLQLNWNGDTRGVPWYVDMACVGAISGSTPPALASQGYASVPASTPGATQ